MSTTQKYKNFVSEPLGNKPVTALPGVGKAIGQKLEGAGYSKAQQVVGKFMVVNKSQDQFQGWMHGKTNANPMYTEACYNGVKGWTDNFTK